MIINKIREWFNKRKQKRKQENDDLQWRQLIYIASKVNRDMIENPVCYGDETEPPIYWGDK